MLAKRVSITGLGLMGGSLALALRPYLQHLTVVDIDPRTLAAARKLADAVTMDFAAGVRQADLVILATPVRTIVQLLDELPQARPEGCLVFDLGSTKADVCRAMARLPESFAALGGHPMCGRETAGFAAATPDLFHDQPFVLCRHERTTPLVTGEVLGLLQLVGARPLFLEPDVHDSLVAATSHLPYLAAAALVQTVASLDDERAWQVSASGLRDSARLAGSDPRMMLDILLTNKTAVLAHLAGYQQALAVLADLLQAEDETALAAWLAQTQRVYARYKDVKGET